MTVQFECFQEGCPFLVRAASTDEIVHLVDEHAEYAHDLDIERDTIESEIERM
ncbi:DUF1059 domain-containing protein [Natrinema halophilum]|uniref:DUF1059 domain-containing protein n=1 Tax=Natrinema halophilum TaxID=1699371 RepID=A0A7D5KSD8_9EURY|nr:DUF1059 domain-containing protein [Natrinema halophilum]QLG49344.1 DUF1059 domain-containing protein [Natrinema halophilum]